MTPTWNSEVNLKHLYPLEINFCPSAAGWQQLSIWLFNTFKLCTIEGWSVLTAEYLMSLKRKKVRKRKNTSVSYQFISHSNFLPKKIVALNPWWIWRAEVEQSAGVTLKCGCRACIPFPAQLLKQWKDFKVRLAVVPVRGGCGSHQLALEKKRRQEKNLGGMHPFTCQDLMLREWPNNFQLCLSRTELMDANETQSARFQWVYVYT